MEFAMANDKDQELNNNSKDEEKIPIEDIPIWQENLQDSEEEDTNPVEATKFEDEDSWVKEIKDTPDNSGLSQITSEDEEDIIDNMLPGWLSELSEIDSSTPDSLSTHREEEAEADLYESHSAEDPASGSEITEKIEIDPLNVYKNAGISDPAISSKPNEEGFFEISEFAREDIPEHEPMMPDNDLSEAEELPQWLEEMIAESDKPHLDSSEDDQETDADEKEFVEISQDTPSLIEMTDLNFEELSDEPTQPIDITQENILVNDTVKVETSTMTESNEDAQIQPDDNEPEEIYTESDPISISEETAFLPDQDIQEEEYEEQLPDPDEIPLELLKAKSLLEQGDYTSAMEVIHPFIEKKENLSEIQSWLDDIAYDSEPPDSDIWEAIGDIALIQSAPEKALNAYTEAIKSLLILKEDNNAID